MTGSTSSAIRKCWPVRTSEFDWEGADAPIEPSGRSVAHGHVNQRRDPAVFDDIDGLSYLLYVVAGESGIALAEIDWS